MLCSAQIVLQIRKVISEYTYIDCPQHYLSILLISVCGPIHNLRRTLTDRSMSFSWQKPLAPKCDVENYIVQYKVINNIA